MFDSLKDNITSIIAFVGTIFAAIFGYITGRGKSDAETDSITIGNFKMGYEAYQQLLTDLEKIYEKRIIGYEQRLVDLTKELHDCKLEMQQILRNALDELKPKRDSSGRFIKDNEL